MITISCKNKFGEFSDVPKEKISFRPSVYGVIVEGEKIALLTVKNSNKFWFPGGGIELGEKIEDALKREIKEETDLEVEIIKPLSFKENFFCWEPDGDGYHVFLLFYLCRTRPNVIISEQFEPVDDVVEKPRWIEIKNLKPDSFFDISEYCWKMVQSLTK